MSNFHRILMDDSNNKHAFLIDCICVCTQMFFFALMKILNCILLCGYRIVGKQRETFSESCGKIQYGTVQ